MNDIGLQVRCSERLLARTTDNLISCVMGHFLPDFRPRKHDTGSFYPRLESAVQLRATSCERDDSDNPARDGVAARAPIMPQATSRLRVMHGGSKANAWLQTTMTHPYLCKTQGKRSLSPNDNDL